MGAAIHFETLRQDTETAMQRHDFQRASSRTFGGLGYAEDFTTPFLVTFGVVLFIALCALVLTLGWLVVFLTVWSADTYMRRVLERRAQVSPDARL